MEQLKGWKNTESAWREIACEQKVKGTHRYARGWPSWDSRRGCAWRLVHDSCNLEELWLTPGAVSSITWELWLCKMQVRNANVIGLKGFRYETEGHSAIGAPSGSVGSDIIGAMLSGVNSLSLWMIEKTCKPCHTLNYHFLTGKSPVGSTVRKKGVSNIVSKGVSKLLCPVITSAASFITTDST